MNPTYAEIRLKNLIYNYNSIRRKTKCKIMAVVKADAYGHGMIECVKALSKLKDKPEYYGVALEKEAIELRDSNIIKDPILCFGPFKKENIELYLRKKILPSITSIQEINALLKLKLPGTLKLHVNVNTGMNRIGISFKEARVQIERLNKISNIKIDGIYTHFATSDEKDKKFALLQLSRFSNVLKELQEKQINFGLAHTANSGAIIDIPESYFDMVRPGISLYGYFPSQETSESINLKPVMSVYSKLSTVSSIHKGETVGYGRIFKAAKQIFLGSVPVGYADGFSRAFSNKAKVIIGDRLYDQIGIVSMDRININLKDFLPKINCKVILLGSSKSKKIDAWDWATKLNTIPYEITCNISKRVTRKYI